MEGGGGAGAGMPLQYRRARMSAAIRARAPSLVVRDTGQTDGRTCLCGVPCGCRLSTRLRRTTGGRAAAHVCRLITPQLLPTIIDPADRAAIGRRCARTAPTLLGGAWQVPS